MVQELANANLPALCQAGNKLNKDSSILFARTVNKMSLAKGIKLPVGVIGAWEECLIEDLQKGSFEFNDFISACNRVIRSQVFNRIDYADLYAEAKDFGSKKHRLSVIGWKDTEGNIVPMPDEIRKKLNSFQCFQSIYKAELEERRKNEKQ